MIDRNLIGRVLSPVTVTLERGRLAFFALAIGETDPVCTDVAAARAAGYADLPAPPTILFGLEADGGRLQEMTERPQVLLGKVLHGEQVFKYHRPLCAGDTITMRPRIKISTANQYGQTRIAGEALVALA